jgi:hypothetical protein
MYSVVTGWAIASTWAGDSEAQDRDGCRMNWLERQVHAEHD